MNLGKISGFTCGNCGRDEDMHVDKKCLLQPTVYRIATNTERVALYLDSNPAVPSKPVVKPQAKIGGLLISNYLLNGVVL